MVRLANGLALLGLSSAVALGRVIPRHGYDYGITVTVTETEYAAHCASISTFTSHVTLTSGIHLPPSPSSSSASEKESGGSGSSYALPVLSTESSGPVQPSSSPEAITTLKTTSKTTEVVTVPTLSSKRPSGSLHSSRGEYPGSTASTWSSGVESSSPEEPTGSYGPSYEPSATGPHSSTSGITSAGPVQPSLTESHVIGTETPTHVSSSSKSHTGPGLSTGLTRSHLSTRPVSSKSTNIYVPTPPTGVTSGSPHQPSSAGGTSSFKSSSRVTSHPQHSSTSVSDGCAEETSTQRTLAIESAHLTEYTRSVRGPSSSEKLTEAPSVPTRESSAGSEGPTSYGHTYTETYVSTGVESAGPTAPESLGSVTLPGSTRGNTLIPTVSSGPDSSGVESSGPTPSVGTSRRITRPTRWSTEKHPTIPGTHHTHKPSKTTIEGPFPTGGYGTDTRQPVSSTEDSHPITQSPGESSHHPTYQPSSHGPRPSSSKPYESGTTIDSSSPEEPTSSSSYAPTDVVPTSALTIPTEPVEPYPPVYETSTEDSGPIEGTRTTQLTTFATTTTAGYHPGYGYRYQGDWDRNRGRKGHWYEW